MSPTKPELVVQADLGGMTIAFTGAAEASDASINATLDLFTKALGRQRAKMTLAEKLVDLLAGQKALQSLPGRQADMLLRRAEERIRLRASFEAGHAVSGRREFKLNHAQVQGLASFDAETEAERTKFANEQQGIELQMPVIEAQIERLRAVIAGRDPTEALETERVKLAGANDMAEAAD